MLVLNEEKVEYFDSREKSSLNILNKKRVFKNKNIPSILIIEIKKESVSLS